jgi:hypothetical protein
MSEMGDRRPGVKRATAGDPPRCVGTSIRHPDPRTTMRQRPVVDPQPARLRAAFTTFPAANLIGYSAAGKSSPLAGLGYLDR